MTLTLTSAPSEVPFTVIDQAVHVLDTAAEPWGIELELTVARLDDDRLREAVWSALARHPLTMARQLPARRTDRTWTWQIRPCPMSIRYGLSTTRTRRHWPAA